jgi:3-oxoacyl-[acyl-carrier protein] reductase
MLGNVLIVGGTSSVAPEIIDKFAAGAHRVIVTRRKEVPEEHDGGNISWLPCELTVAESREALTAAIARSGGGIDVVVFLAGAILGRNLEGTSDADMDALVAANLTGPARLLRDLLPVINPGARVIFVSSIAGERGSFDPLYAATKGALIPFAKSLATWAGSRMSVIVVAPGAIEDSTMVNDMSPERVAHHRAATPTGCLLSRQDFASIVFDIAQPHWRHANGAVIRVNGGSYV